MRNYQSNHNLKGTCISNKQQNKTTIKNGKAREPTGGLETNKGMTGGVNTWNSSPFMIGSKQVLCQADIPRNVVF